jgi:hypothetical protein
LKKTKRDHRVLLSSLISIQLYNNKRLSFFSFLRQRMRDKPSDEVLVERHRISKSASRKTMATDDDDDRVDQKSEIDFAGIGFLCGLCLAVEK